MKLSQLTLAVAGISAIGIANAGGLELSQQPLDVLFEEGNHATASFGWVTPRVQAKDLMGQDASKMINAYGMTDMGVKIALDKTTGLAFLYSQPWGVDSKYKDGNIFNNSLDATQALVKTHSFGLVGSMQLGSTGLTVYGGGDYQTMSGGVKVAKPLGAATAMQSQPAVLTGVLASGGIQLSDYQQLAQGNKAGVLSAQQTAAFNKINNIVKREVTTLAMSPTLYEADFESGNTFVPVIGLSYAKPEIALRASVTYRGPAQYESKTNESLTIAANADANQKDIKGTVELNFPQSVAVDFQTGLSAKYQLLGFMKGRWVNWSSFNVAPPLGKQLLGGPLVEYEDDQFSGEIGLAKQITPKLAGQLSVNYDYTGGADDPLTLLGPYGAVTGVAAGVKYDVTKQLNVSGGAQYMFIDGGEVPGDAGMPAVLTVDDSTDGYALGMSVGYSF